MRHLVEVLMDKDGLTKREAVAEVKRVYGVLQDCLASGDLGYVDEICENEFGLEPDFLIDLMSIHFTHRSEWDD